MATSTDAYNDWGPPMYMYAANNANLNPVPGRSTHHPSLSSPYVDHAGLGYVVAYPQQEYIGGEFSPEFQIPAEALPYVYCPPHPPNYASPYNPYNPFIPGAVIEAQPPYMPTGSYPYYPSFAPQPVFDYSNTSPVVNTRGLLATAPGNVDGPRYFSQTPVDSTFPTSFKPFYPSKLIDKAQNFHPPLKSGAFDRTPPSQVHSTSGQLSPNENSVQGNGSNHFESNPNNHLYTRPPMNNRRNSCPIVLGEQNRGPRSGKSGGKLMSKITVKAYTTRAGNVDENGNITIDPSSYNLAEFPDKYPTARFFVIKSYSEDDVHKSIKYNMWSSTPSGNKRLDVAYDGAKKISESKKMLCPVFLFFSVNASGQFCGVSEMKGPVDFHKDMDFWQQDKWSGSFPVKWHIVKDVANSNFRHIILENNENKSVTNSRDTQEVPYKAGVSMLNIFKESEMKMSIFDDFCHYEERQRIMYEEKCSSQQKFNGEIRRSKNVITVGSMTVTI